MRLPDLPSRTPLRIPLTLAVLTLGVTTAALARTNTSASHTHGSVEAAVPGDWLLALKGSHRQLFDAATPNGGMPLVHVLNYYDTYNSAFKVKDEAVNGVLTFYGYTTFHGLSDAMWAKYKLGEFLGEKDAHGTPFTVNPWRTAPTILGMELPQASIESLQKRGATFLICNNALTILSGMVAQQRGLDPQAVLADMKAHILPNVVTVPAMVIAIEQAQNAGMSYHRQ